MIDDLRIRKILNSRGEEIVEVDVYLVNGYGRAAAPAGASRGSHEVIYFPNGDVDLALRIFRESVRPNLVGMNAADQVGVDAKLEEVDGTSNFSKIGGAVAIATSMATAKAAAIAMGIPLYKHLGGSLIRDLPYPLGNIIGGGKHSRNLGPDIQEFLVIPIGARDIYTALKANVEIHREVFRGLVKADPGFTGGRNDEGAWSARISTEAALSILREAANRVSAKMGIEVGIGIDVAASTLWDGKAYVYVNEGVSRNPREQYNYIKGLVEKYSLIYVEDPFHEEEWNLFAELTDELGHECLVVGDDLFTTSVDRLRIGVKEGAGNSVIIKPDQVGTLSRAFEAARFAANNGYTLVVSHRSGETEYELLAHVAVALGAPVIKAGVVGGERVAKLNELIRIWEYMGKGARMSSVIRRRVVE